MTALPFVSVCVPHCKQGTKHRPVCAALHFFVKRPCRVFLLCCAAGLECGGEPAAPAATLSGPLRRFLVRLFAMDPAARPDVPPRTETPPSSSPQPFLARPRPSKGRSVPPPPPSPQPHQATIALGDPWLAGTSRRARAAGAAEAAAVKQRIVCGLAQPTPDGWLPAEGCGLRGERAAAEAGEEEAAVGEAAVAAAAAGQGDRLGEHRDARQLQIDETQAEILALKAEMGLL